jgi:Protein of unknown function (DUF3011)
MKIPRTRFLAAIAGLLLLAGAGGAAAQDTVRCESQNGQYRSCSVNTSGGVTLSRQLSSQGCWQNDTWGYDRNRIWVNRGCRAEFRVGSYNSHNGNDGAKVAGALALGVIAAAAIANHDKHDDNHYDNNHNDRYNNYNYNNNNAYDYGYGGQGQYNRPARELTCASRDGRYTNCGYVDPRSHVEVRRQLSNAACIYGRSWGVDRTQLWVDRGCRATFVAY